jgi:uncharacterized membrane protein (UPF0127 family)
VAAPRLLLLVFPFAALGLVPIACSSPVEEPVAIAQTTQEGPDKPGKRCIKPTPETPSRVVKGPVPDPNCPADPDAAPKLELGVVHFPDAQTDAGVPELAIEIAEKYEDRMRGLMYRKSMGADAGMLFIFEKEAVQKFWMKNTCIPLDMLFIGADGVIVGIEENTPTLSEDTFSAYCPGKYVLETNAGWTRQHGIKAGQKMTWNPIHGQ